MIRRLTTLCAVLAFILTPAFLSAQDVTLTPIPQDASALNVSGVWTYTTGAHRNSGPCPSVPLKTGELKITTDLDSPVMVDILSGELCGKPMHLLSGAIEWGNMVVGNAAIVDDEGGQVFNSLVVYFFSEAHGSGLVRSRYTHPGGMRCDWSYRIEFGRP